MMTTDQLSSLLIEKDWRNLQQAVYAIAIDKEGTVSAVANDYGISVCRLICGVKAWVQNASESQPQSWRDVHFDESCPDGSAAVQAAKQQATLLHSGRQSSYVPKKSNTQEQSRSK